MDLTKDNISRLISSGGLTFIVCMISVIVLPIYVHLLPVVMGMWVICWIYENKNGLKRNAFTDNRAATLLMLFILFYLWQISGLLIAESLNTGLERLFKRISFLIFPLVLFYPGKFIIRRIRLILLAFALATFVYILYCFANALLTSVFHEGHVWMFRTHPPEYPWESYFFGSRFSDPVHPSYLAMYIILAVIILFEHVFDNCETLIHRTLFSIIISIFLISIYLLSARAGILAAIFVIPAYFLLKFYQRLPKWIVLIMILSIACLFVFLAQKNERINNSINNLSDKKISEILKKDPRILIWQSALGVIKKNPVFGVGTGDATKRLKEEFVARGYMDGYYDNLNAHNQFLEIWLENGLIGILCFLAILVYMVYISVKQQNILLGLFVLSIIIFFLFETMMNRLAGISFFALFAFLLIQVKGIPVDQKL